MTTTTTTTATATATATARETPRRAIPSSRCRANVSGHRSTWPPSSSCAAPPTRVPTSSASASRLYEVSLLGAALRPRLVRRPHGAGHRRRRGAADAEDDRSLLAPPRHPARGLLRRAQRALAFDDRARRCAEPRSHAAPATLGPRHGHAVARVSVRLGAGARYGTAGPPASPSVAPRAWPAPGRARAPRT